MGCCHLKAFSFKTGTALGQLGRDGLILAPLWSLHAELANLPLSHTFPGGRSWARLGKSMQQFCCNFPEVCLFHGHSCLLSLVLYGSRSQGTCSVPGIAWALSMISLRPPTCLQLGEPGPEGPCAWSPAHSLVVAKLRGLGQACLTHLCLSSANFSGSPQECSFVICKKSASAPKMRRNQSGCVFKHFQLSVSLHFASMKTPFHPETLCWLNFSHVAHTFLMAA